MTGTESKNFYLGDWLVEPAAGRVTRGEESATLRPREMDLLVYLARRPGEVRSADDIIGDVWSGVHVTNDSLYFSISQLRKVLDDKAEGGSVIETIPKRGYRLKAEVRPISGDIVAGDADAVGSAGEPDNDDAVLPASDKRSPARGRVGEVSGVPVRPLRALAFAAAIILVAATVLWFALSDDAPTAAETETIAVGDADGPASIAVMPFIDLTPETDYTYFSDGITEEILNRLTRIPGLRVAARTSSFTFKDSGANVVEIARSLGVANLLEGSVRKEGDRVRIAVQLIDAATGFRRWSETYERRLTSVFEIQNEISSRVADVLQITLVTPGNGGDKADRPASPEVLDEYLLGLEALRTQSFESLAAAVAYFENVLDLDPSFNNARVQLAAAQLERLNTGATSKEGVLADATALLQTAIDVNPENAAAHRVLGRARMWTGDREEARQALNRALDLSPSDSEAMIYLAQLKGGSGDMQEARRLLQRAVRLDPFSSLVLHYHSRAERGFGAIDNAREARQRAVDLHPDNPNAAWLLGKLEVSDLGNFAFGLEHFLTAASLDPADYEIAAYVASTFFTLGMPEAARPWVEQAERTAPEAATTLALHAIEAALAGQHAAAFEASLKALGTADERMSAHAMITQVVLPLAISDFGGDEAAESAISRFDRLLPTKQYAGMEQGMNSRDEVLAFMDLPRRRLVTMAALYKAAGRDAEQTAVIERLAYTRIDAVREFRDRVRNDDYFIEAEIRAIEGDTEGAFAMLEKAVDNDYLYLWQINYGRNPAFAGLQADPRWDALMARVRARIDEERSLLSSTGQLAAQAAGNQALILR